MKAFITLAVVCLVASALSTPLELTEEQKAKVKTHSEECIKQENISQEEAARLENKDLANPTQNMKCFGACLLEKMHVLKDGRLQESVVLEKFTPVVGEEKTKAALAKCKDVKGADRCETAYKLVECAKEFKA